jgi:S-adenosylmethionine decarboxylase
MNALAQLGMVSVSPSDIQISTVSSDASQEERTDYFVVRDGMTFAGTHLLIDLWGASRLDEPDFIDATLRESAVTAGATILHSHFHHFTPNGGVSGVIVLAESHISIHTWPERSFAAIDVFMCGACDPRLAIPVIAAAFGPDRVDVSEERRGRVA